MEIDQLVSKINQFKNDYNTEQSWQKNDYNYENDFIKLYQVTSSNVHGGKDTIMGKQWNIIIDVKKSFENLEGWILLSNRYKGTVKITKVRQGQHKGKFGIRFYKMSSEPTISIIEEILNFIFK